ncbi:MAG: DUF3488 and transglutaminase-like domain-containing protein [Halobacteriaceae archaeon]
MSRTRPGAYRPASESRGPVATLRRWAIVDEAVEAGSSGPFRLAALASLAVVTGAYLATLYDVVAVVGGRTAFVAVTGGALALGVVLGATLRRRAAVSVAGGLLVAGLGLYLLALPPSIRQSLTVGDVVADTLALLTGYRALQLVEAGLWATAVAPGPTFLAWFFGARGEYGNAAAVAGLTLGFFVLTGDAGPTVTLVGVLAAASVLAFGALSRADGGRDQLEVLAATFALVILAAATVSAVPGGGASPLDLDESAAQNHLVSADDSVSVGGSLTQSAAVRFVVDAERPRYWRVAPYDRFTGSRWLQSGTGSTPVEGTLPEPPGERALLRQTVEARAPLRALPAAATPYRVDGVDATVDSLGALRPRDVLRPGEQYTVESLVPTADEAALARAGTDYPAEVTQRYTQVPANTPDAVSALAANVTATASNPYEAARAVERWLEATKGYSLSVPDPGGNIAGQFLTDMEAGYCVYFASAMVTMLRTQGVPARYVVGYTSGQRVDADTFVVRGLDAHAWVEVYFPGAGWHRFDPTPATPRRAAERELLAEARASGVEGVDAAGSAEGTFVPTTTTRQLRSVVVPTPSAGPTVPPGEVPIGYRTFTPVDPPSTATAAVTATTRRVDTVSAPAGGPPFAVPPLETLALWGVLLVGLAAGARRSGAAVRAYRAAWVRIQPRGAPPAERVEGAFERAMYVLGRRTRERRSGETVRAYLAAIDADERVRELVAIRERARYAGTVSEADAERARELAADVVADR